MKHIYASFVNNIDLMKVGQGEELLFTEEADYFAIASVEDGQEGLITIVMKEGLRYLTFRKEEEQ